MYPRLPGRYLLPAALGLVLAGCGGEAPQGQEVRTPRFAFVAPDGWQVERRPQSILVRPEEGDELLSVTVVELRRAYDPRLFPRVTLELDRLARTLAGRLGGVVRSARTRVVAGRKVRQYDLAYTRDGVRLVDRMTFVLRGKTEYLLVCRLRALSGSDPACAAFVASFRPVS